MGINILGHDAAGAQSKTVYVSDKAATPEPDYIDFLNYVYQLIQSTDAPCGGWQCRLKKINK